MRCMDTFTRCPVCMDDSGGGLCSPECADAFDEIVGEWEPTDVRMFATSAGAFVIDLSSRRIRRVALPEHPVPAMRVEGEWHDFYDCDEPTVGKPFRIVWKYRLVGRTRVPDVNRSTPVVFVSTCVVCGNRNVAGRMPDHECDFGRDD